MTNTSVLKRAEGLSQAMMKIAKLLPENNPMASAYRNEIVREAAALGKYARGLEHGQKGDHFIGRLDKAVSHTDACGFWIQQMEIEQVITNEIAQPLLAEADALSRLFIQTIKKASDKRFS